MPIWTQHLLVLLAVSGCVGFIAWQAVASLQGRKSRLNGCGTCKSCGSADVSTQTASARLQIVPTELLKKKR